MSPSEEPNHVPEMDSTSGGAHARASKTSVINSQPSSERRNAREGNLKNASIEKICERCANLDLSVDRFLINSSASAGQSQFVDRDTRKTFSPKYANSKYQLGTYEEIESRGHTCNFCDLVARSVDNPDRESDSAKTTAQLRATCFATWEIDGRSADNDGAPVRARTRRLHLQWEDSLLEDAYLVLVTQSQHVSLINSDARNIWQENAHYLARKMSSDDSRETLIKSWLDDCLENHGTNCLHSEREKEAFRAVTDQSFFGVIDVQEMRLTNLPRQRSLAVTGYGLDANDASAELLHHALNRWKEGHMDDVHDPYVALSYVWGDNNAEKTVHDNVLMRLLDGGLEEPLRKMPKDIQDAVELVRRLGYRYLWIDALCIVQNSSRSWKLNAEVMDMIYGNADLTICAADGTDANAGLRALRRPAHSQISADFAPGLRLMVSRLAETGIKKSKWNTRGWTFQERLLSRRCLIFNEGRVVFQCRSAAMSEDIVTAPGRPENHFGWSLDLLQSPLKLLDSLTSRPIWFYMNCVQLYSARDLTKPGDILAAFSGVSNQIEDALNSPLIFGLPSSHFDLALLWAPLGACMRREEDETDDERFDDEPSRHRHSRYGQNKRETNFPSWSWCGWKGCTMGYLTNSMLDDCLDDVNDWLMHYTWIQWHIRDGRGRLRPLWDSKLARQPRYSKPRWYGYKVEQTCLSRICSDTEDTRNLHQPGKLFLHQMALRQERGWQPTDVLHEKQAELEEERRREEEEMEMKRLRMKRLKLEKRQQGAERKEFEKKEEGSTRHDERILIPHMARNDYRATARDQYGRYVHPDHCPSRNMPFRRTIPESPYRVNMAEYTPIKDREYPDSPILQFWTHSAFLRLYHSDQFNASSSDKKSRSNGVLRFSITDVSNDWCGSILLSEQWVETEQARLNAIGLNWDTAQYEFLALSNAKKFTEEECGVWTYYLPLERNQSEWDLYYVLLTEKRNGTWSRVALGKVFSTAFDNGIGGLSKWKEIVLV